MREIIPSNSTSVLIICEGYEEYDYITQLKQCKVWDSKYRINIQNAKSLDEIIYRYQYAFQNGNYEIVLVFCDTEKEPYRKFKKLCASVDDLYGRKAANKVVFFANPCTMQIILSHFAKVKITSNQKSDNAKIIRELTGVIEYSAQKEQRAAIIKKINAENYVTMKNNLADLSSDYRMIPSTNFIELLKNLEQHNEQWVRVIKNKIS